MEQSPPTFVVPLTPPGRSALAVLLVAGPRAEALVGPLVSSVSLRPFTSLEPQRIALCRWQGSQPEEVVVVRRPPGRVEINCHGGAAAIAAIIADLVAAGATRLNWTEWLSRGADPLAAEAQIALAEARTERTAAVLLDQFQGALAAELRETLGLLRGCPLLAPLPFGERPGEGPALSGNKVASVTLPQPLPEREGSLQAATRIDRLVARGPFGRHLVEPWSVVLCGPPNVGKSSLINAILGYRRAIVLSQPGTTRDVVVASTAVDGWPIELADTAGVRETEHALEAAGIAAARERMAAADLRLLVFDGSEPLGPAERQLAAAWPDALIVHNKSDLPPAAGPRPDGLLTSAITGANIEALVEVIAKKLVPTPPEPGAGVPFRPEHVERLAAARDALSQGNAIRAAAEIASMLEPRNL